MIQNCIFFIMLPKNYFLNEIHIWPTLFSKLKSCKNCNKEKLSLNTHWTYLLQILSKLCFQMVAFSGNYEIVAIITDKNTFLYDLDYKADIGQHSHKSEKSIRWRHCHKIIKNKS